MTWKCSTCGGPLPRLRFHVKHCSGKCRQKAYRDRVRDLLKSARAARAKPADDLTRALSFNGRLAGVINTGKLKRNATVRRRPGRPRRSLAKR